MLAGCMVADQPGGALNVNKDKAVSNMTRRVDNVMLLRNLMELTLRRYKLAKAREINYSAACFSNSQDVDALQNGHPMGRV